MGIKQKQILEMLRVSRTTLWRRIKDGSFPSPNKENPRVIFWTQEQIDSWVSRLK